VKIFPKADAMRYIALITLLTLGSPLNSYSADDKASFQYLSADEQGIALKIGAAKWWDKVTSETNLHWQFELGKFAETYLQNGVTSIVQVKRPRELLDEFEELVNRNPQASILVDPSIREELLLSDLIIEGQKLLEPKPTPRSFKKDNSNSRGVRAGCDDALLRWGRH
jgi:hypothetical protein